MVHYQVQNCASALLSRPRLRQLCLKKERAHLLEVTV
jgi:hypothetical protein